MIIDPLEFIGKSVDKVSKLDRKVLWKYDSFTILSDEERLHTNYPRVIIHLQVYIIRPTSHLATILYDLTTSKGKRVGCNLYVPYVVNDINYQTFLNRLTSLNIKYTIINE